MARCVLECWHWWGPEKLDRGRRAEMREGRWEGAVRRNPPETLLQGGEEQSSEAELVTLPIWMSGRTEEVWVHFLDEGGW